VEGSTVALTIEQIHATGDSDALFQLLSDELQRLLPSEKQEDRDWYFRTIETLPRGLRAMAGIYEFDVSMTMDDLAWHFGNQNDERDLRETENGLRELDLPEIAELFARAWKIMEPHFDTLRRNEVKAEDFSKWLRDIGAQAQIDPMNKIIWAHCEEAGELGLLASWPIYARKYPERCVSAEASA
jgi:hypothetical protein